MPERSPETDNLTSTTLAPAHERPSWVIVVLMFLLFSGPPMFRVRDPTASLDNEIDPIIVMQVSVWLTAGLWLFFYLRKREHWQALRFERLHIISLVFLILLGLSSISSVAPALTAFKVFQMAVCVLLTLVFVQRYGVEECLDKLFWFSLLLCAVVATVALIAPDLVYDISETGALRLRGELIAPTGVVSMLALVLLLGWKRQLWKPFFLGALLLSSTLLVLSLERTAYVAVIFFILLALWNRRGSRSLKWIVAGILASVILFLAFGGLNLLTQARDPESIWTLSDRVGLWAYLSALTISKAPWTGLGYYSASRLYGPDYNPGLGTAHSMFVEAFVGAGLPALITLVVLVLVLMRYGLRMISLRQLSYSTVTVALLVCALLYGVVGAAMESGALAITFWSVLSILAVQFQRESVTAEVPRDLIAAHDPSPTES